MAKYLKIRTDEALRLYRALAKVRYFLHRPNEVITEEITEFRDKNYTELSDLYYDIVWDWFPEEIQAKIMEDDY